MSVNNKYQFYRNSFSCALIYDEDKDTYFGYIGFTNKHEFFGSRFQRLGQHNIYHINISFDSAVLNELWWMGFSEQTTYQKSLDKLKEIADLAGQKEQDADKNGFNFL